jgi:D-alanyl-lipoteichoic acid acyltransferase DltB (MBOAT superfamily)
MSITSLAFVAFCVVAILVYWLLPSPYRTGWLFAASIGFLLTWAWDLAAVLLVVATVNFYLGRWLEVAVNKRRFLLWTGIGFNVLVLVALKYNGFYVSALTSLLEHMGVQTGGGGLKLLLPVGLSFITVQMISYLVDIHNKILKPEPRWLDFTLYVVYFPKLLSGPVERARTILPKFKQPSPLDMSAAEQNAWLIVVGLMRKLILADTLLSIIPGDIFLHPESYVGQDLAVCLLAYAFVIYNDFAGYTSIVRGVSGFFGIELTNNFKLPYFARNFTEFWDRWHVSLSQWLRDYIFFPVSRALAKKVPNRDHFVHLIAPPIVTMLVSGMWHGLGWNFLVWGGLHGLYLFFERLTMLRGPRRLPDEWPKWRQVASALVVFGLVVLAWIPFRMDLATAWHYLSRMFTLSAWAKPNLWLLRMYLTGNEKVSNWADFKLPDVRVFLVLIPALLLDWNQHRRKSETFFLDWPAWARGLFLAIVILALLLLSFADTGAPFIYQGF